MTFLSKIALEASEVKEKVVSFISSGNADCALCAASPVKVDHKHFLLQSNRLIDPNEAPKPTVIKCGQCNNASVSLMCSQCNSCFYCSHECQASHWPAHSYACSAACSSSTGKSSQEIETNHHTSPVKCDLSSSSIMSNSMADKSGDAGYYGSPSAVNPQSGETTQPTALFGSQPTLVSSYTKPITPYSTPRPKIQLDNQAAHIFRANIPIKTPQIDLSSNTNQGPSADNSPVWSVSISKSNDVAQDPATSSVATPVPPTVAPSIEAVKQVSPATREPTKEAISSITPITAQVETASPAVQVMDKESSPSIIPVPVVEVSVPPGPIVTPVPAPVVIPTVTPVSQPVNAPAPAPAATQIVAPVEKVSTPANSQPEARALTPIPNQAASADPATNGPIVTNEKDVFDGIISHTIPLEFNKPAIFQVVWNSELSNDVYFISQMSPQADTIVNVCASTRGDIEFGALPPIASPKPGTFCLSKQDQDPALYRAKVIETTESGQVKVYFIDYGNFDLADRNKVWPLPPSIDVSKIPAQANPCRAHDEAAKRALQKALDDYTDINLTHLKKQGNIYTTALA